VAGVPPGGGGHPELDEQARLQLAGGGEGQLVLGAVHQSREALHAVRRPVLAPGPLDRSYLEALTGLAMNPTSFPSESLTSHPDRVPASLMSHTMKLRMVSSAMRLTLVNRPRL
jgi:hypothetical protein